MLSVANMPIMLSVVMMNVIALSVVAPPLALGKVKNEKTSKGLL